MSAELPADPKVVKKMEKTIAKEAQADEREYQRALKELKRTGKSAAQASKATSKADKHLKRMEDKEHDTVKSLQKATHNHDRALTDLHTAQGDLQVQKQRAQRLKHNVDSLRARADELFNARQIRDEQRGKKLASLHSPDRTTATTG